MTQLKKFESGESIHDPSFREKLNAAIDSLNEAMKSGGGFGQEPEFGESRMEYGIPVRITDYGSADGFFEFEELEDAAPGWSVKAGGLTHTDIGEAKIRGGWAAEEENYPIIGRVVYLQVGLSTDSSGDRVFEFEPPGPILFPISMTQTGGSAGDKTTQCSFTYTVNDIDGNQLATAVDPTASPHTYNRPTEGALEAADAGIAYYENNSNAPRLVIAWCNEVIDVSEITTQGSGGGRDILDVELYVESTANVNDTVTIDADDYSGRIVHYVYHAPDSMTDTEWDNEVATASQNEYYIGTGISADQQLFASTGGEVFIDASAGNSLVYKVLSVPAAGRKHRVRLHLIKGVQKTAADYTLS